MAMCTCETGLSHQSASKSSRTDKTGPCVGWHTDRKQGAREARICIAFVLETGINIPRADRRQSSHLDLTVGQRLVLETAGSE
jgi:hypothetical protein